jgi:hypothetical protein
MSWEAVALCLLLLGFGIFFIVRIIRIFANGRFQLSDRIAIFSTSWLLFCAISTWAVFKISDIAAGYWMLGVFAFPLVFSLFYGADQRLSRTEFARRNTGVYMTLMCLAGMLLYWPGYASYGMARRSCFRMIQSCFPNKRFETDLCEQAVPARLAAQSRR